MLISSRQFIFLLLAAAVLFVVDYSPAAAQCQVTETEPNDSFASADPLPINCLATGITVQGESELANPDLFSLTRAFSSADRLRVHEPNWKGLCALFNSRGELLLRHSGYTSRICDLDFTFREPTNASFVGITTKGMGAVAYEPVVSRDNSSGPPAPAPQRVLLDFDGGENIAICTSNLSFPAFNSALLGEPYAGQTEYIIQRIVNFLNQAYDDYRVEFYTTPAVPPTPYSTVYFGGYSERLFGLADGAHICSIDAYNSSPDDNAIVYIESFRDYGVLLGLTTEEISQMVANVAAHELGHLLGLWHTADEQDLMDTTASARALTRPQSFTNTVLEQSIFPVGNQNSPGLLRVTVGPAYDWWSLY